ncbi:hypothetical protein Pse7367_1219 [Thalassoporum mexicanum PCC 7367]|uniref:AbiTii domain-containing protein n=1 Tax=Thalassoporum mexicanum TaxID=3457544 RepID=UPI00029FB0EC|nr:hypothetical protein [Pseudanabaena sp. PCC 7367]AFY69514.1 hypothetical protein Pse7367_1219 [Pseudanabaena sp. PCC 7367]
MSIEITHQLKEFTDRLEAIDQLNCDSELEQPLLATPLSGILLELWQLCQSQTENISTLANLANCLEPEIYGYDHKFTLPDYRKVQLDYIDQDGQKINTIDDRYRAWNLTQEISKLEAHQKNGLTLTLIPQITDFLSQMAGQEVFGGYVSAKQVQAIVIATKEQVIKLLTAALT